MLRKLNPEIALGFFVASLFWIGVVGWQSSYSPTEKQKDECYEAAKKTGHKGDECKSFWERTTSDPIALFNLILAFSTVGLWIATIFLYRAGEKQIGVAIIIADAAKKSARAAQKSADALVSAERARLFVTVDETNILDVVGPHGRFNSDSSREDELDTPGVGYSFKNFGRTHATLKEVGAQLILGPKLSLDDRPRPETIREPIVGPQAPTEKFGCNLLDTLTVGGAMDFKDRKSFFWLDGHIIFEDAFGVQREYQFTLRYRSGENGFRLQRQRDYINEPDGDDDWEDDIPF